MDRIEAIRARANGIPLVGPLTVALLRYDEGDLACEISRMARNDVPALLAIAEAALDVIDLAHDVDIAYLRPLREACRRFQEGE